MKGVRGDDDVSKLFRHNRIQFAGGLAGVGDAGAAAGTAAGAVALPPRILYITVPHVGHLPLMALRPFLVVTSTASPISFLALHLTQYPSGIKNFAA